MGRRLSLDTGILVGFERGTLSRSIISADDDICLSIVVLAEYMAGVELAQPQYRPRMQRFLDGFLSGVAVLPYDEEILDVHVTLLAWTHRNGRPRGQYDLLIAATSIATDRVLLTQDKRARFDELPGLTVEVVDRISQ